MQIRKLRNSLPATHYAPYWDFSIGNVEWDQLEKADKIRNWLIDNEEEFLKKFPVMHDGNTGLGEESITSRFGQYNLFDFSDEIPELNDLKKFLQLSYLDFVTMDNTPITDLHIVCWFNILHTGQEIKEHLHNSNFDCYLSGNLHLDNYKTMTNYKSPFEIGQRHSIANIKGGLTIFPSCVMHWSDKHEEPDRRVSIAFDLRPSIIQDDTIKNLNARPFMSQEIYQDLIKQIQQQLEKE
jgi:hypothetical protein